MDRNAVVMVSVAVVLVAISAYWRPAPALLFGARMALFSVIR